VLAPRFFLLPLAVSLAVAAGPGPQEPASRLDAGAAIRVDVSGVTVGVKVTTPNGKFLSGLRQEDFRIFDNGVEQSIRYFSASRDPGQLVLLIENGAEDVLLARMGKSPFAVAAGLVDTLPPATRVAAIQYSERAQVVLDFTADRDLVQGTLRAYQHQLLGLQSSGSKALHLSAGLTAALDWLDTVPGSKTIVLVSSGLDTSPPGSWPAIQEKFLTSDVRVIGVSILGDFRKPPRSGKLTPDQKEDRKCVSEGIAETDRWMGIISTATGGRAYFPRDAKDFARVAGEIAEIMRGDYSLGFAPPALDGHLHTIQVRVKRVRSRVLHRNSYMAALTASLSPAKRDE